MARTKEKRCRHEPCYLWRSAPCWSSASRSTRAPPTRDTLVIALDTLGAQVMDPITGHARPARPLSRAHLGLAGRIRPRERRHRPRRRRALGAGGRRQELDLLSAQGAAVSQRRSGHRPRREVQPRARHVARSRSPRAPRPSGARSIGSRWWTTSPCASTPRASFRSSRRASRGPSSWKARSCRRSTSRRSGAKGFRDKPVGSGPWKFVRSVPGDRIEYEAVTCPHWRGTPQFKRLTLLLVPEQSTRLAMVRTGEASIASIGPEAVKEARAGGMKVVSVPGTMQADLSVLGPLHARGEVVAAQRRPRARGAVARHRPAADHRPRHGQGSALADAVRVVQATRATWTIPRWDDWSQTALRYDPRAGQAAARRSAATAAASGSRSGTPRCPGTPFMVPDRRGGGRLLGEDRGQGRDEDGGVGRVRSHGARRAEGARRHRVDVSHGRTAGADRRATRRRSSPRASSICSAIRRTARRSARRPTRPTRRWCAERDDAKRTAATNRMIEHGGQELDRRADHRGHGLPGP